MAAEARTALVTGATRGIGRALAGQLSAAGFRVFATGRNQELLRDLKNETGCEGEAFDLASPDQVFALYRNAVEALERIDVLVNNAGMNNRKAPVADTTLEEFDYQYAVNLRAPYILCREAMRDMGARQEGHIVNVLSTCAKARIPTMGVYSAMKCALDGLTGSLIKEAREYNVKVTAVYPGGTDTDFRKATRPEYMCAESAAAMIVHAISAPADVVVHELTYRPMCETNF
ncbi:MAG: SDR family oxidoreductase [Lentisphaeria bacterium]|nr:SDR family oxidoreductase [Lentisphaeria bacterium]